MAQILPRQAMMAGGHRHSQRAQDGQSGWRKRDTRRFRAEGLGYT